MRIKNNGKVGIGVINPQEKLHLGGNLKIDPLAFDENEAGEIRLLGRDAGGTVKGSTVTVTPYDGILVSCVNPILNWFSSSCGGYDPDNMFTSANNVGIGAENPQAKLDIQSNGNTTRTALHVKSFTLSSLMKVRDNGIVEIGAPPLSPSEKLTVNGNVFVNGAIMGKRSPGALSLCGNTGSTDGGTIEVYGPGGDRPNQVSIIGDKIVFAHHVSPNSWPHTMEINENGQVGINWDFNNGKPSNTDYKLAVNGKIYAQGFTIKLSQYWPDFVFKKSYTLMSLDDLKNFIEKNGHLPNIPTAADVEANGIDQEQINML